MEKKGEWIGSIVAPVIPLEVVNRMNFHIFYPADKPTLEGWCESFSVTDNGIKANYCLIRDDIGLNTKRMLFDEVELSHWLIYPFEKVKPVKNR